MAGPLRRTDQRGRAGAALDRANKLYQAGKLDAAVAAYRAILKRNPHAGDCWCNLGAVLRKLGRRDEGLEALRQGVRICPKHAGLNHNLGNALADAGDSEAALESYRAAISGDPGHLGAAVSCSGLLYRLARYGEVRDCCQKALQTHPDHAHLYSRLGLALARLRRPQAAASAFRRAIALKPDSLN